MFTMHLRYVYSTHLFYFLRVPISVIFAESLIRKQINSGVFEILINTIKSNLIETHKIHLVLKHFCKLKKKYRN